MNVLLWILQGVLGVYFFITGIVHFIVPPGLPAPMAWMYELPPALHYLSGTAEILAGLGLILPGLTRIQTRLIPLAALGLVLVMLGAAIWHLSRNEFQSIVMNLILGGLAGFVAYGRWRLSPLKEVGK
ncbi:MAG: DoxX family protein [Anaerolineae bacterium]|nr:DoxX family protein [Thermoflexus sp.]MDW8064638.1 DoxX family protein [Anaerolineae bacterium]